MSVENLSKTLKSYKNCQKIIDHLRLSPKSSRSQISAALGMTMQALGQNYLVEAIKNKLLTKDKGGMGSRCVYTLNEPRLHLLQQYCINYEIMEEMLESLQKFETISVNIKITKIKADMELGEE